MDALSGTTIALAATTFLLAIAAFSSVYQTGRIRQREERQRLLNEIIGWATDATTCESHVAVRSVPTNLAKHENWLREHYGSPLLTVEFVDVKRAYEVVYLKSPYIVTIASKFSDHLRSAVVKTSNLIWDHMQIIDEVIAGSKRANDCVEHRNELINSMVSLVRQTAEIKALKIGRKQL